MYSFSAYHRLHFFFFVWILCFNCFTYIIPMPQISYQAITQAFDWSALILVQIWFAILHSYIYTHFILCTLLAQTMEMIMYSLLTINCLKIISFKGFLWHFEYLQDSCSSRSFHVRWFLLLIAAVAAAVCVQLYLPLLQQERPNRTAALLSLSGFSY